MKKKWLVALFKASESKRLEINMSNQNFDYYLPKITIKKVNSRPKEEALFPGYIFVNTSLENYSALKYTIGIKNIIKFGENISYISSEEIKAIQDIEESSKVDPIQSKIQIGQDIFVSAGSFKGNIAQVCSLPSRDRVAVFLYLLGSMRRVNIPLKDLAF
jgi:transcription antitermination factor NusG